MAPSSACHCQSIPCTWSYSDNPRSHYSSKTPASRQRWNLSCTVLGATERPRQGFPLAAGPQHVEDTIHALVGRFPRPPALRPRRLRRQYGLNPLPQCIGNTPISAYASMIDLRHVFPPLKQNGRKLMQSLGYSPRTIKVIGSALNEILTLGTPDDLRSFASACLRVVAERVRSRRGIRVRPAYRMVSHQNRLQRHLDNSVSARTFSQNRES